MQIIVTTTGRQALVNAQNTGTSPVLISHIGLTSEGFVADAEMTSLPGELKRLSTFAGAVVDEDTIHVTIRDDSTDVYGMRGFGLYLNDGTLFALYGQTELILDKSSQAMMLLAADVRFVQINAASLAFGDTNWINPPASTSVAGVVELATSGETNIGNDAQRAVTPTGMKFTLDERLGVGAPSSFVKGLLNRQTAELVREKLEIKSAALKNDGAGNGLDADKLDGQEGDYYRAWTNLTDVPSSFIPGPHTHADADITSLGWSKVTGIPSAFPPTAHGHVVADISGAAALSSGSFTATLIGMASATSGIVQWRRTGNKVTLYAPADILGTSSGSALDMTGLPSEIRAANTQHVLCARLVNGGITALLGVANISGSTITFARVADAGGGQMGSANQWASSGNKGLLSGWSVSYDVS